MAGPRDQPVAEIVANSQPSDEKQSGKLPLQSVCATHRQGLPTVFVLGSSVGQGLLRDRRSRGSSQNTRRRSGSRPVRGRQL